MHISTAGCARKVLHVWLWWYLMGSVTVYIYMHNNTLTKASGHSLVCVWCGVCMHISYWDVTNC